MSNDAREEIIDIVCRHDHDHAGMDLYAPVADDLLDAGFVRLADADVELMATSLQGFTSLPHLVALNRAAHVTQCRLMLAAAFGRDR
jgi:hypothetical protein